MLFVICLIVSIGLSTAADTAASPVASRRVIVEARIDRHTLDGAGRRGCATATEVETAQSAGLWFTFGDVSAATDDAPWEATGASSHCGTGAFADAGPGTPYLIMDIELDQGTELRALINVRKLERFDDDGHPVYRRSSDERAMGPDDQATLILPLLVPDPRETLAFQVHEVMLRLDAETLPQPLSTTYGKLSISADVPGAWVLIDDHRVGRTSEDGPTVVSHVPVGSRNVKVVDVSSRSVGKTVTVKSGELLEIALDFPQVPSPAPTQTLVPIGGNLEGFDEFWRGRDGAIMVRVPAGEFIMGSPEGVGQPHERPQHTVHVSEFLIDKTEVTWRQFRKFSAQTGTPMPKARVLGTPPHHPAHNVGWEEARDYCAWVGGRLPTEAEWEKAARGTDGRSYPWGNDWDPDRCNSWIGGPNRPIEVGEFATCSSPYGLLDMAGNMWEWCADVYDENYYATSPPRDPQGPSEGKYRVLRGGDWIAQPLWLRTTHRYRMVATGRYRTSGFRCAQDPEE